MKHLFLSLTVLFLAFFMSCEQPIAMDEAAQGKARYFGGPTTQCGDLKSNQYTLKTPVSSVSAITAVAKTSNSPETVDVYYKGPNGCLSFAGSFTVTSTGYQSYGVILQSYSCNGFSVEAIKFVPPSINTEVKSACVTGS